MLITDHINLTGHNPLIGEQDERLGLRYPDMSNAYDRAWLGQARAGLKTIGLDWQEGVYACVAGPSLETSAERRFLRVAGADAVGMSTVMEVIAAIQAGFKVLGISAITNMADGGPDQQADPIEKILANATRAGQKILQLLPKLLS